MEKEITKQHGEEQTTGHVRYPTSCSIVVINRCPLACKMCHMWKAEHNPQGITIEECKQFVSQVQEIVRGNRELVISGGEPLLKEGIFDLIACATSYGMKTIMPTNGYLINEDVARKISDSGLSEIFISLDSFNPTTHNFLRGRDGCFERVMQAIELLNHYRQNLRINILAVISNKNSDEVIDLLHRVQRDERLSGIYFQVIAAPFFTGVGNEWRTHEEFSFLWPHETQKIVSTIDEIIRLKKDEHYIVHNHAKQLELYKRYFIDPEKRVRSGGCYLGDYIVNVDQEGNISLCCFDSPVGNIRTDDIRSLWFSEKIRRIQETMHTCERNCHNMVNCFFKEDEELV